MILTGILTSLERKQEPKSTEWTGLQEESDTLEVIFGVETSNLARSMA